MRRAPSSGAGRTRTTAGDEAARAAITSATLRVGSQTQAVFAYEVHPRAGT